MTELDESTLALLQSFGFEEDRFHTLRQRASAQGGLESNAITDTISPPTANDLGALPAPNTQEYQRCTEAGVAAIREGHVASVVLAGGMATRFGGVVKATVEVHEGLSFLEMKLRDAERMATVSHGRVPVFFMTSFATHSEVTAAIGNRSNERVQAHSFPQYISLRLDTKGEIYRDTQGEVSPYAPGHGDLPFALVRSGLLQKFRDQGGRVICMSNVDNLTATLDPALIGWHLLRDHEMTVEVTAKHEGDKGGAPAWVGDNLEIVEGFRFPNDFDQDSIPVFNTNTLMIDTASIRDDLELDFFAVRKKVGQDTVVQFERLVGQLTAHLSSAFIEVPREGVQGRFHPVKDPDELKRRLPEILAALEARGIV